MSKGVKIHAPAVLKFQALRILFPSAWNFISKRLEIQGSCEGIIMPLWSGIINTVNSLLCLVVPGFVRNFRRPHDSDSQVGEEFDSYRYV